MLIKEWTLEDVQERLKSDDQYVKNWAVKYCCTYFPDEYASYAVSLFEAGAELEQYEFRTFFREKSQYGQQYVERLLSVLERCDHNHGEITVILGYLGVDRLPDLLAKQFDEDRVPAMDPEQACEYSNTFVSFDCEVSETLTWKLYDGAVQSKLDTLYCSLIARDCFKLASRQNMGKYIEKLLSRVERHGLEFFKPLLSTIDSQLFDNLIRGCDNESTWRIVEESCLYIDNSFEFLKDDVRLKELCSAFDQKKDAKTIAALAHSFCLQRCEERSLNIDHLMSTWEDRRLTIPESLKAVKTIAALETLKGYGTSHRELNKNIKMFALCAYITIANYPTELLVCDREELSLEIIGSIVAKSPVMLSTTTLARAASFGVDILPVVNGFIKQEGKRWCPQINATKIIELVSKDYPEECLTVVPLLIEELNSDCSDYYAEAAARILKNLFPYCKDVVFEAAKGDESTRAIYAGGVLSDCAGPKDINGILELYDLQGDPYETVLYTLERLANPECLGMFLGSTADRESLELIVTIAKVNDLESPELIKAQKELEKINEEREAFLKERMDMLNSLAYPSAMPVAKKKSSSKAVGGLKTSGGPTSKKKQANKKKKKKKRK